MADRIWRVRLSKDAKRDLGKITSWTRKRFGTIQAIVYRDILIGAITALRDGPNHVASKSREEMAPGIRMLHVARLGKNASHVLIYRTAESGTIEIVRILHDRMEISKHLSAARRAAIENEEPED